MSTLHTLSQPGAGTPMPNQARARLRGIVSRRFARVYLEGLRQFHIWRHSGGDDDALRAYVKTMRRCDRLQAVERGMA